MVAVSHGLLAAYLIAVATVTALQVSNTVTTVILCILGGLAGLMYAVRAIKE